MVGLSKRQRELIELASEGHTDKEIAQRLSISVETVHSHWKKVRADLGVASRSEAIAKHLMQSHRSEVVSLELRRQDLAEKVASADLEQEQLAAEVARLRELAHQQAELLRTSMANAERRVARVLLRLEELETLNEEMTEALVILHRGEFGASWRKYFISESINQYGIPVPQWKDGSANFFDFILPQYVARNIPAIRGVSEGTNRVVLTYELKTPFGTRFMMDLLKCEIEDSDGVGTYSGLSIDITDWAEGLRARAEAGWFAPLPAEAQIDPLPKNGD